MTRRSSDLCRVMLRSGSETGQLSEGAAGLDNDIINININYINYINYNTKLVQTVDELAVADTGTK